MPDGDGMGGSTVDLSGVEQNLKEISDKKHFDHPFLNKANMKPHQKFIQQTSLTF